MRKIISVFFITLATGVYSQTERDSIIPHPVWAPEPNDTLVARYEFQKPPVKNNIIDQTPTDSTFDLNSVIKIQLTSILANKLALSYEKVFNYKFSLEIQPAYIFANPLYDAATQSIWPNIAFKNQGFEIKAGLNLLMVQPYRSESQKLHSKGLFISYRYQHADNVNFSTDGKGGQGYHYNYRVSQTKNLIGVFYRKRVFDMMKKVGAEYFYEFGVYAGYARTVCFSYSGAFGDDTGEPMEVQNVGMPFENGFIAVPVIRLGMAIRYDRFKMP